MSSNMADIPFLIQISGDKVKIIYTSTILDYC